MFKFNLMFSLPLDLWPDFFGQFAMLIGKKLLLLSSRRNGAQQLITKFIKHSIQALRTFFPVLN